MDIVVLIGRIVFSLLLFGTGIGHLTQVEVSTNFATKKGLPQPRLGVIISGVALVAGGIGISLGIWADLAALLTAILVAIITVTMHAFWTEDMKPGDPDFDTEISMFMKNTAIIGACLVMFGIFGDGYDQLMITDPLF